MIGRSRTFAGCMQMEELSLSARTGLGREAIRQKRSLQGWKSIHQHPRKLPNQREWSQLVTNVTFAANVSTFMFSHTHNSLLFLSVVLGMATEPPVSVAIVGLGLIGPRHARAVLGCRETVLSCLVDPSPSAADIAKEFRVPLFENVQHMFSVGTAPDAAIICTPNKTHVQISRELIEGGVDVLVEKPISTDIESGKVLVELAEKKGRRLLVGHHRRFNPYVTSSKQAIEQGVVGNVIAVSGLWTLYKPPAYFEAPLQWHASAAGGGVVCINLIHDVDILQYIFGPIVRIHAEQTISHRDYEAEEGAAILLRFASGVVGTFILSDATPSAHNFESGTGENPMIPKSGQDFYRIFGTSGTLSVGDMKVSKYRQDTEKSWTQTLDETEVRVGSEVPFDEQVEHLAKVVRGHERPRCSGEDGLRAVIVCEAVKKALKEGGVVDIR